MKRKEKQEIELAKSLNIEKYKEYLYSRNPQ